MSEKKFGVIAIMDALGMKAAARRLREKPSKLVDTLNLVRVHAATASRRQREWNSIIRGIRQDFERPKLEVKYALLSDTVVVALTVHRLPEKTLNTMPDPLNGFYGLLHMGGAINELLRAVAEAETPLLYRGCISVGHFYSDDQFFFGDAVDEAAALYEEAAAAIVWTTPSASDCIHALNQGSPSEKINQSAQQIVQAYAQQLRVWIGWDVPLKLGSAISTFAVNPVYGTAQPSELRDKLLKTFDSYSPDVIVKRQNTAIFLDQAIHAANEYSRSVQ